MAQTNYTPIQLYYSTTAAAVPVNTNLASGELAININDGILFYKDNGGTVQKIGYKLTPTTAGGTGLTSFTNGGIVYASSTSALATGSALTWNGSNLAVTGTLSTTGAVTVNGGTASTAIAIPNGASNPVNAYGATTGSTLFAIANTGGTSYFGNEGSTASISFTGTSAYATCVGTSAARPLQFVTNSTVQATINSSGIFGVGVVPTGTTKFQVVSAGTSIASFQDNSAQGIKYVVATNGAGQINHFATWESSGVNAYHAWYVTTSAGSQPQAMTLDASGNLGLGVTPSNWNTSSKAFQWGANGTGTMENYNGLTSVLGFNFYRSAASGYLYTTSYPATSFGQDYTGAFTWSRDTGTRVAGTAVNFTTAMTLDASGNLGIGTSSPQAKLQVKTQTDGNAWFRTYQTVFSGSTGVVIDCLNDAVSALVPFGIRGSVVSIGTSVGTAATFDASGNLGLGVTPSAWSALKAIQLPNAISLASFSGGATPNAYLSTNIYFNGSNWIFNGTYGASRYEQVSGQHQWFGISSGTANATATLPQLMTLDASGNLLVGKTSSSGTTIGAELRADGSVWAAMSASTNATSTLNVYSTGASAYRFYVGLAGTVYATSTTITAISDQRLKENIRDLDDGLATVMELKPRKFDWKTGKGKDIKNDRGFIAQEFEMVLPDMVEEWKDPAPEGQEPYKAVNANLIPTLVKAIQELKAEIDSLKSQLNGA